MKVKVYIAGPYTQGDVAQNVRQALDVADILFVWGFTPFIPHLTHFWHLVSPKPYQSWLEYDAEWLRSCDIVLRMNGESAGADYEVELAGQLGIPVVTTVGELLSWSLKNAGT